ncbi:Asp-tRNA(Asn)/Glu-tRNA(Gln) amidotransferase subunit GatA [Candidatus Dojkabacteria bacterium]|nr:Asp-tRNA(Asn)/Glu-tRNA(Gln) amidotransferase subunit GatA [Candidatus Dojkabacteria bacterium]
MKITELKNLTITKARKLLDEKQITSKELIETTLDAINIVDPQLNCYLTVNNELAIKQACEFDKNPDIAKEKPLAGLPIAVKDVFVTKDIRTTCGSKILDKFIPPYESTVTKRLKNAGAIFIGKTNLDEFCHGSSTETSAYGPTKNPWDTGRLAGGSSGGSAAATATDLCVASVGTETAGSIRQPAAWCGVTGIGPTYGRVPRFGVIAMGSSLDRPGPITKTVEDSALILSIIAGKDENDATSSSKKVEDFLGNIDIEKVKKMRVGVPKEFFELDLEKGVRDRITEAIDVLKNLGAKIIEVNILDPKYAIAVYTIVCRSEVSSNLSRYQGTRFSSTVDAQDNISQYFAKVRGTHFGPEAKRRVMTGTFALSSGYYDEYYKKAALVRRLIEDNLNNVFKDVDIIVGPTTPSVAAKLGSTHGNPLFGELADVLIESCTMSLMPGISVPCGFSDGLPVGFQMFAPQFEEQKIIDLANSYQQETDWHTKSALETFI